MTIVMLAAVLIAVLASLGVLSCMSPGALVPTPGPAPLGS